MNRQQIRERVRFLTLVEPHEVSDVELDGLINEGFGQILTRAEWPWSINNVSLAVKAGDWSYDIGSEGWSKAATVVGVHREDSSHLRSMSVEQALRIAGKEHGRPEYFTVTHERKHFQITLIPVPDQDQILGITFRGGLTFHSGASDEPPWHYAFHELLVDFAAYRVWEREEDDQKSAQSLAKYETRLGDMMRFYNQQTEDRPRIFGERQRPFPRVS